MANLPLDADVDISVDLSPTALTRNGFNIGMILAKTDVISTDTRVQSFSSLTEILEAGFAITDPAYLGAQMYFNQQDNLGASISELYIGAVGADETYVEALTACRNANNEWYAFACCDGLEDADNTALADAVESLESPTIFFLNSNTAAIQSGTEGNLFLTLQAKNYDRTIMTWHENNYASCGVMGYAMGANTGLANSAYTLKFKTITGLTASTMTSQQVKNIENANGNVYVTRAAAQYEQGVCASGTWADEIINLDKMVNDMQLGVYDILYGASKIPQTEAGQSDIAGAINDACETARKIGFLATGKWRRSAILNLAKGDTVPNGYLVQWEPVDDQTDADRDARKAQPFYVCLTLAGAVHSVVIQVKVSR